MINDLKLGIKIMRYGYGLKTNIILGLVFLACGVLLTIINYNALGGIYMLCAGMMPVQVISSVGMSNMALASPCRKRLLTAIPTVIMCGGIIAGYIVEDLLVLALACIYPDRFPSACAVMEMTIVSAVLIMIYFPISYKYMLASIMFILVFTGVIIYGSFAMDFSFFDKGISSFALISAAGLPIIAAGGFLQYLVSLLVYKAPISKYSQNTFLRKDL